MPQDDNSSQVQRFPSVSLTLAWVEISGEPVIESVFGPNSQSLGITSGNKAIATPGISAMFGIMSFGWLNRSKRALELLPDHE